MGTCWSCNKEVTLSKEQTKCDSCGEILFYACNSCKKEFNVENDKQKLQECKLCGYFFCPYCGVCSYNCKRFIWRDDIMRILAPEISFIKFPFMKSKINQIIEYIINEKTSNKRKECINHIPITYAKGRIKSLMVKLDGFRVKNIKDRDAFVKRVQELTDMPTGFKTTISNIREEGSYGQEYRDAFNLLVCLGKMQITWIPATEDKPEYALYERVDNEPCKYLSKEDLVINECKKCNTKYPLNIFECSNCIDKKGKNKGNHTKTKKRLNNCDTCQMYRGDFE
jgi:hypothetical protein